MEKARLASAADQRSEPPLQKAATPWLVIPYGKDKEFHTFYNISELNNTSSYRRFLPELKGKSLWQKNSHQGWCILLCDDNEFDYTPWSYGDCLLWNPIAPTETIMLPSLLYWYRLDGYCLSDCVLSSPPRNFHDDGWNGNPMVFILFVRKDLRPGKEILVFCHLGDKEWRSHKFPEEKDEWVGRPESMFYHKGKLYMIVGEMFLFELEIINDSEPEPEIILSISKIGVRYNCGSHDCLGRSFSTPCTKRYYVESSDEIFMIKKVFIPRGVYDEYCVTNMLISKFEFSSRTWVGVTSLDDHVLFLSGTTTLCCSAKELGFARGWVYFTQPREMSFCKYDLEDKTFMLSMPCPDLPKPWFSPNWLMIPTTLCRDDHSSNTKVIENSSLAISPIRPRTSINNDDDEKEEVIEEARPPWDILSEDILWFLSSYLSLLDYTHLRAVCRNYRSVFPIKDWRKFCSTRTLRTNVLSPWMVFPKDNESVYSFINPVHNDENYLTSIPELLKGLTIRCSKGGWLLMSNERCQLLFYNPFTKEIIQLPVMMCECQFRGMSFSSLPTSSDCVVFGISDDNNDPRDFVYITFIKRGQDSWTFKSFANAYLHLPSNRANMNFDLSVNSPVYYCGSFCCLDLNGTVGAFSLENGMMWQVLSVVPPPNCGFIYKSYLVELEGKLLSILLGHYGTWVRVFRLDLSKMVWVEVEHLGKHVLFISNASCITTIAPTSQMENKIYFPRLQNEGILFYSLDSGKYHSLGSEHYGTDYCNSKDNLRCSWIEPNWSETTHPNFVW